MFSKIFSDNTLTKLKKVPVIVWYLVFALVSMFSSLYGLKQLGIDYLAMVSEMFPELNTKYLLYLFYPSTALMSIVIFELIAYLAFTLMNRKFSLKISQIDFVFRLRLTVISINFVIGIISLIYYALPGIITITNTVIMTFFNILFLSFFIYEICNRFVPFNNGHNAYSYMARLYLGIYLVFSILGFFANTQTIEYIASVVEIGIIGIMCVFSYSQYKKLKDKPKDLPPKGEEEQTNIVFKDFDF